ncbi:MAG: translocation protein TolB [Desulfovibrionaceae bacterium]
MTSHMTLFRRIALAALVCCGVLFVAPARPAHAVTIDIYGPGQKALRLAMAKPMGTDTTSAIPDMSTDLQRLVRDNLSFLPFFDIIPADTILGGDALDAYQGEGVDFRRFQIAGADLLVTTGWPALQPGQGQSVELRAYEVFTRRLVVGKAYFDLKPDDMPLVADKFCAALMETLTGHGDFFLSTLAFVRRLGTGAGKQVWTARPTGRDLTQISHLQGICLSPSWSNDGRYIIFTHMGERYHSMGVYDRRTGRVHQVKYPGNTIIGPTFTPENKVAVSLASGGNPDIYLLNHVFQKEKVLVENWAIDVSPRFSRDGSQMAFVSSRLGNPHIFIKDMATGKERRLTMEGNYNTDPSISPYGKLVAFVRRTNVGHRIFIMDVATGKERQITFGPGNDEQPAFGPDGYFIVFTSSRSGRQQLYFTTRHGSEAKHIPTGDGEASHPAWGHIPQ